MKKPLNPTNLRDRCLSHFAALGIPIRPEALDAALDRAQKEGLSSLEVLDLVIGQQAAECRERSTERRIKEARFAERKTLETFDWKFNQKAINRVQIEELATGDFIRRRSNLLLVGQSGVGKSHLIQALGIKACALGYRVQYRTSAQLIADLTASLADKTLPQRLRLYSHPDLLIIDEFGFDRVERLECPQAAHLLYKVIASRNQQHTTALVTNVDFDQWPEYLADGPLAMAFLDRLVEGATIIKIKGDSYRAHGAGKITAPPEPKVTPQP
jgi:DNA replication protein DnaC